MSYDVTIADEEFNYTSNLSRFFSVFGVHPLAHMNGQPAAKVAGLIDSALAAAAAFDQEELAAKWDSPNGWGKMRSALPWLADVRDACRRHPDAVVLAEA